MEKNYLNFENLQEVIAKIYEEALYDEAEKYCDEIEEMSYYTAQETCESMKKYCHQKDTRMSDNLCNIREDWECCPEFIGSEIQPWGCFDDVVKSVDDGTISDDDLAKFQTWCMDWFFRAFGTWGLKYNFQTYISELEYERERELEECAA